MHPTRNRINERAACALMVICGSMLAGACSNLSGLAHPARHVILVWLKHPTSPGDRAQVLRAARALRMMPGVLRVDAGRAVPPPPAGMDRSFDVGVVITFRDRAALQRYEQDPRQRGAVGRYVKPLVRRYEVYNLDGR
jgi:hypothetical protein